MAIINATIVGGGEKSIKTLVTVVPISSSNGIITYRNPFTNSIARITFQTGTSRQMYYYTNFLEKTALTDYLTSNFDDRFVTDGRKISSSFLNYFNITASEYMVTKFPVVNRYGTFTLGTNVSATLEIWEVK